MAGLAEAYLEGQKQRASKSTNPFLAVLNAVDESIARRTAEDQERKKEERQLKNVFLELGKKYEYETELQKQKGLEERKTEVFKGLEERETEALKGWQKRKEGREIEALKGREERKTEVFKGYQKRKEQETEMAGTERLLKTFGMKGEGLPEGVSIRAGNVTFTGKPSLEQEATRAEVKKLAEIKPNLDRANEAIQELKGLFEKGDVSKSVKRGDVFSGLLERGKGVKEGIVAKMGGNPELQQYLKLRKSFASLITKGGFLEAGVLTNPDIERALGSLPTTGSTKEEIEIGWKTINNIMTSAQRKFEQLKSGGKTQTAGQDKQSGQIMIDAQGNKAMVYPDGSYEEMQ